MSKMMSARGTSRAALLGLPLAVLAILTVVARPDPTDDAASLAAGKPSVQRATGTERIAWQQAERRTSRTSDRVLEINADGYTSARVCGGCHTRIYETWRNSLHAFALTDPIFDTAFMQSVKEGGEEARRLCLSCHAPLAIATSDYDLELGVSREGVSCDFCHSVTAVHTDGRQQPYETDPGLVKRGVVKHASSPAHETEYSELHLTSEFCGGCHNFVKPNGTTILGTYDEWRAGPYAAEQVQCQNCHMVLAPGSLVNPDVVTRGHAVDSQFHLHSLIHDTDQLRSALRVEIVSATRRGENIDVIVELENVGSGHMVPTGVPTREIVLAVTASSGSREQTRERRFRKVIADENGRLLETDYEVMLYGARLLNDNRLAPREPRQERFSLRMPRPGTVKVTANIFYQYAPAILDVQRMNIRLGFAERYVQ